jgi:hypothetical protein
MRKEYTFLEFWIGIQKFVAIFIFLIGIVAALLLFASSDAPIIFVLGIFILGVVLSFSLVVAGEFIRLIIDIQNNSEDSNNLLHDILKTLENSNKQIGNLIASNTKSIIANETFDGDAIKKNDIDDFSKSRLEDFKDIFEKRKQNNLE